MEQQNRDEETKSGASTGSFLEKLLSDKLKCLYLITLVLQVVFIVLQFVPFVSLPSIQGLLLGKGSREEYSMLRFHQESGLMFIFILLMFLYAFSFAGTLGYFVKKGQNRYTKFRLAKTSVILMLLWYVIIFCGALSEVSEELYEKATLTFGGHLYWIVAVALLVLFFITGFLSQQQKEDEKVAERVQAELDKKRAEEVASAHINNE